MIQVKCKTADSAKLTDLVPFQDESKKRKDKDIEELAASILEDGLIQPLSIWLNGEKGKILDGHGRFAALIKLAMSDPSILTQDLPVVVTDAATEEEAVKACLQCMSSYGKVNKPGVIKFASQLIDYKAPVLNKAQKIVKAPVLSDGTVLKIRVSDDKVKQLRKLLSEVDGVEVLS